jgi:hypothetical protein
VFVTVGGGVVRSAIDAGFAGALAAFAGVQGIDTPHFAVYLAASAAS